MYRVLSITGAIILGLATSAMSGQELDQTLSGLLSTPFLVNAGPEQYTCPIDPNRETNLNDFHIRGTSLGGWMVLEPWLTPSLFYQFLGASKKWGDDAKNHVGIDSKTFCTALGSKEANRQLRNHWKTWVDEYQIRRLAEIGVEHLRIPIADWMYVPYEPFIGCWDGALEEMDRVLGLCEKYNIGVLLDLHAVKHSQNGLDNSGDTSHFAWVGNLTSSGAAYYEHWNMRGGDWIAPLEESSEVTDLVYVSTNVPHIIDTLHVVNLIVERYKNRKVVMGLEPVNEPWDKIPLALLKEFYWRSYQIIQLKAPHWITLLHDSFRLSKENFGSFMTNCDNYAIDSHIYQAWAWENTAEWFQEHACEDKMRLVEMEALGVPIVVGEWSLATDNCAMWLNGLNDNVPGYPKVTCEMIECPAPYMGKDALQPNAPPDKSLPAQDPFGTGGVSYVEYGMCPRDRPFAGERDVVRTLSYNKLHAFDHSTHGQFFWNFRTEFETRWDYQRAVELGWIPTDWNNNATQHEIKHACDAVLNSKKLPNIVHRPLHDPALTLYACLFAVFACIVLVVVYLKHNVYSAYSSFKAQREGYEVVPDSRTVLEEP